MKKSTTRKRNGKAVTKQMRARMVNTAAQGRLTVGLDLGDRSSVYCILDANGEVISKAALNTSKTGLNTLFEKMPASRVALEVGTHSPWVSRHLAQLGHEVIVANPRQVALIGKSSKKDDRVDAEKLARLARVDPELLSPVRHRGEQAQVDLAMIRARATLVEAQTKLINAARGLVKSMGERLANCDSEQIEQASAEGLSPAVRGMVEPMLKSVEDLNAQIGEYDQRIKTMEARYPEVDLLQQVYGVGTVVSPAFVLTIEDAGRFRHSREVGPYLGMTPRRRQSSGSDPELGISKQGDRGLRTLLVQAAHCLLRKGSPDTDLRRWAVAKLEAGQGEAKGGRRRGGKSRKKRVVIAVARRLAVLLHHLWVSGEVYEPLYQHRHQAAAAKAAA